MSPQYKQVMSRQIIEVEIDREELVDEVQNKVIYIGNTETRVILDNAM